MPVTPPTVSVLSKIKLSFCACLTKTFLPAIGATLNVILVPDTDQLINWFVRLFKYTLFLKSSPSRKTTISSVSAFKSVPIEYTVDVPSVLNICCLVSSSKILNGVRVDVVSLSVTILKKESLSSSKNAIVPDSCAIPPPTIETSAVAGIASTSKILAVNVTTSPTA